MPLLMNRLTLHLSMIVPKFLGKSFPSENYTLKFASDKFEYKAAGQIVTGLTVRGINCSEVIQIPRTLATSAISDTTE